MQKPCPATGRYRESICSFASVSETSLPVDALAQLFIRKAGGFGRAVKVRVYAVAGGSLQRTPDDVFLSRHALPDALGRGKGGQHGMAFVIKHYSV